SANAGRGDQRCDDARAAHSGVDLGARRRRRALARLQAAGDPRGRRDRRRARKAAARGRRRRNAAMTARGLIVAGPRSAAGKTTVTLALLAALGRRGIKVKAAKAGPDYIDSAFHAAATGANSVNLDSWAMPPPLIDTLMAEAADDAELIVVEGV